VANRISARAAATPPRLGAVVTVLLVMSLTPAYAQTVTGSSRIVAPVDERTLVTLTGNHPLARPEFDRGAAPDELPMNRMHLLLKHSQTQEAAALLYLDQQQDESSPNFHRWLTPEEFGERFGPSITEIQAVTSWLQSHGFQVTNVTRGRHIIEFSGTAAQVNETFHTPMHRYVVRDKEFWANASDPQIPAALAPVIAGIASLNNFPLTSTIHPLGIVRRATATGKVTPIGPAVTFPPGGCLPPVMQCYALGPYDFDTIYNVLPLWKEGIDGRGQSIAIVAESNINLQDVRDFRALFALPANDPQIILNGPDPGLNGAESEALGDVSWAGAVAKNAAIKLVVSASTVTTAGPALSAVYIVDNNLAPVMNLSFVGCERLLGTAGNAFLYSLFQQAAAQGITVAVAASDSGPAACDSFAAPAHPAQSGFAVSGIASTPFDVALGGTDFSGNGHLASYFSPSSDPTTKASALSYIPEVPWDDTCVNPLTVTFGWSSDVDTLMRCNDPATPPFLLGVFAGAGGSSNCTVSDGVDLSSCQGGYPKPTWQAGVGVPADGKRDLPDVSFFTAGDLGVFYIICQADYTGPGGCNLNSPYQDFLATVGGTSIAAPEFSGVMALINQKADSRQGNANYVLYRLAAQQDPAACNSSAGPAPDCIFNDVTQGSNRVTCVAGSPDCSTNGQPLSIGILGGYDAGVGYDLATGLGSMNVANLVHAWKTVAFGHTNTFLSVAPTVLRHGESVKVKIAVAAETGTPTGSASLITSDNLAVGAFPLDGYGIAYATTNALPGGTYSVYALYSGDGSFGPSESAGVRVKVAPESSRTIPGIVTFDASTGAITSTHAGSFAFGSFYILAVDVTNSSGLTCVDFSTKRARSPCPTGRVTLSDNGEPLNGGSFALNSQGQTEDGNIQLFAGQHHIVAQYHGDRSFEPSEARDDVLVTRALTTTSLSTSAASVAVGQRVMLTALIGSQSNAIANAQQEPGGLVQFSECGRPLGKPVAVIGGSDSQTFTANGTAVLTIGLSTGSHSITAAYTGNGNYSGSVSAPVSVIVGSDAGVKACN
jgi:hypothetical protein